MPQTAPEGLRARQGTREAGGRSPVAIAVVLPGSVAFPPCMSKLVFRQQLVKSLKRRCRMPPLAPLGSTAGAEDRGVPTVVAQSRIQLEAAESRSVTGKVGALPESRSAVGKAGAPSAKPGRCRQSQGTARKLECRWQSWSTVSKSKVPSASRSAAGKPERRQQGWSAVGKARVLPESRSAVSKAGVPLESRGAVGKPGALSAKPGSRQQAGALLESRGTVGKAGAPPGARKAAGSAPRLPLRRAEAAHGGGG